MSLANLKYQTIREWEGKTRKITQKEYVLSTGHGQYYPPEGCCVFQGGNSNVAFFLGGARHKKPAHWNMGDTMFKVTLKELADKKSYTIDSFDTINPSKSMTSEPPKLAFASYLTCDASPKSLLAFSVNGKSLDLRTPDMALCNEIHVYELLAPKYTTYRTTTFRTPNRASKVPIKSNEKEVLQQGNIPPPMYASTLTSLKLKKSGSGVAVLIGGNIMSNHAATPIQVMMGLKDIWAEESSGDVFTLEFDLSVPSFKWTKQAVKITPRAHHSTILVGHLLYIFGGTDYSTRLRYDIRPVVVDTVNWSVTTCIVGEDFPDKVLSGHSFLQIDENKCLVVGGYNRLEGKENDIATDELIQVTVEEGVVRVETIGLGSGPQAQAAFIRTPQPEVYILAGGVQERWALISEYIAPAVPCDLHKKKRCLLVKNPDQHAMDTVNWLGCDGPCQRWFHVPCLKLSAEEFLNASKRKKWMCNMSDCKK